MVDLSKLSPKIRQYLEDSKEEYERFGQLSISEKRKALPTMYPNPPPECPNYSIQDMDIEHDGMKVSIRLYQSPGKTPLPVIVYFHGGGWVLGSIESQDPFCRRICNTMDCHIINVGYRLSPENKYPAPIDDGKAVLSWVLANSCVYGFNINKIILAGDSAGGNITAVLTVMFNEAHPNNRIYHQVPIYPVTDLTRFDRESYDLYAEGFGLSKAGMIWYVEQYLDDPKLATDPKVSPIFEDRFDLLSPTTVISAGYDVLLSEGIAYAELLKKNGVPVTHIVFENMIHSYLRMAEMDPMAKDCINQTIQVFTALCQ